MGFAMHGQSPPIAHSTISDGPSRSRRPLATSGRERRPQPDRRTAPRVADRGSDVEEATPGVKGDLKESRVADGSGRENGSSQENTAIFGRQSDISRLPSTSAGSIAEVDSSSKDLEIVKKKGKIAEHEKSLMEVENIQQAVIQGPGSEMRSQETVPPMPSGPQQSYFQGDARRISPETYRADAENLNRNLSWGGQGPSALGGYRQHPNLEAALLTKDRLQDEASKESLTPSLHHMPVDGYNSNLPGKDQTPETAGNEIENCSHMGEMVSDRSADEGDEDLSEHDDLPSSPPKYTMTEKWILDYKKRKYEDNKKRVLEQQKAHKRISASYEKLKENVSSSEDLSVKTKSVIELKKLQLLPLQRRVHSEFLLDFFKPNTADLERVKAVKKHRHGRRVKQLEKIEQKMKEERQKRIRETKGVLFADIEVHRKLEGFLVYSFMWSWNGVRVPVINTRSHSLRTNFLVDTLKSSENECKDIIPGELQDLLKQIRN